MVGYGTDAYGAPSGHNGSAVIWIFLLVILAICTRRERERE